MSVTNGTFIYLTKNDINLFINKNTQKVDENYLYLINKTGQDILEIIDGAMTLEQLSKEFCSMKNINFDDNEYWINEYIMNLISYGALELNETQIPHKKIRVAGKDSTISPLTVTVEVTQQCNLRCKHCYLESCPENNKTMSIENFRQLVSILKQNDVVNIELTGGEFFVNPNAYEILKLSIQNFTKVALLTNGTILDDKVLDLLTRNKDKVVLSISVDSVKASIHDDFRGLKGAHKRTCENIKRLTDNGIIVRMSSSISSINMWEIDKLADLSRRLGTSVFGFNDVESFGRGATIEESNFDVKDSNIKYSKYINDVLVTNKDILHLIDQDDYLIGTKNCGAGVNRVVIGPDGELRPCVLYPHHRGFGNIFDIEYTDLFQKKIFSDISDIEAPGIDSGCESTCKYLYHCKGCYIKALEHNVSFDKPCSWVTSNRLEWLLKFYIGENEPCSIQV